MLVLLFLNHFHHNIRSYLPEWFPGLFMPFSPIIQMEPLESHGPLPYCYIGVYCLQILFIRQYKAVLLSRFYVSYTAYTFYTVPPQNL